jgi:hypothetical protein
MALSSAAPHTLLLVTFRNVALSGALFIPSQLVRGRDAELLPISAGQQIQFGQRQSVVLASDYRSRLIAPIALGNK